MISLRHLSLAGLACTVLAATIPMGCTPVTTTPTQSAGVLSTSSTSASTTTANGAAITGIVFTGRSLDGRLVPPPDPVTIQVLDKGKEVASVQSDALGRFYLSGIPAPKEGKIYTIKIADAIAQDERLFPGRVMNLSAVQLQDIANQQSIKTVSGTLLAPGGQPLANVEVRDKENPFRKTTTNSSGQFTLGVLSKVIEILADPAQPPVSIEVEALADKPVLTIDTNSVRTVTGVVMDSTNSNLPLADVKIRVDDSEVSTRSDKDGKFTLNGAPVGPFLLRAESSKGYADFSVQVPPATFENESPVAFTQNVAMQPVGSVLINFHAVDAPRLPVANGTTFAGAPPDYCTPISCTIQDVRPKDGVQEVYYTNSFGILQPLKAIVQIEGTSLSEEVAYPATSVIDLTGTDIFGEAVTIPKAITEPNSIVSVKLDNVPGGRQCITISMTGFQTQKSIPIYIPPNDTISTELITLYSVQEVSSLGDVKGILKGLDPAVPGKMRIGYLDVTESLSYLPTEGERINPDLLDRIEEAVTSSRSAEVNTTTGEYYLMNVPTGTRIMLAAALVDEDGNLSDCYIPNTSVLLNVRAGQVNLAPDLLMQRRPIDCTTTPSPTPTPTPTPTPGP